MVKKQTKRDDIGAYEQRGIEIFDEVEVKLNDLIAKTAEVLYNGARARDFKTTCTQNAVDFGKVCSSNMISMSEVISDAASYISTNMGADPIAVELKPPAQLPVMPDIQVDETIETADDGVLNGLKEVCTSVYDRVGELFTEHLNAFTQLGDDESWVGPEYDSALADVASLTMTMQQGIAESATTMASAIEKQLTDLGM